MSAEKKREDELEKQRKLEAAAAADAERIKADGGVWKVTLEDQAKYAAEHAPKKSAAQSQQSGGDAAISQQAAGGEYYDPRFGRNGQLFNNLAAKRAAANKLDSLREEYAAEQNRQLEKALDNYKAKKPALDRAAANKFNSLSEEYAAEQNRYEAERKAEYEREVKQAREDEARNALFKERELAAKSAENVKNANSSALDKARRAKADSGSSAADFVQSRSERMGKLATGDLENVEKIKNRDLKSEIGLEWEKIKYQWEEAGRRYDALSDEEKQARYRRYNSSALDRARISASELPHGDTVYETRTAIGQYIADKYYELDRRSRETTNASEFAFLNRLRSAAGTGAENLGLWLYETFGYQPGKEVYDAGEARAISEATDRQVQLLIDAAPSQLGKDLVKVSDSVAQQLSYKILTAPISLFAGSVIPEKIYATTGNLEKAGKAAHDLSGGIYTGGMAMSSAADKYVQARAEGQSKLEASVRAVGTGMISYFTETLGGIGGSKSPLGKLEEKAGEKLITSILYNAFEEGGEEFLEYAADILLDGAADMAFKGEWQQEWSWEEVIENAKIGAMTGGLFGGYQRLMNKIYTGNPETDAQLDRAAREYSDYMKDAYRLQSDPELRAMAERQMGETTIPTATRTRSGETGEMNYGSVFEGNGAQIRRNIVEYEDKRNRSSIQKEAHNRMVAEGKAIDITQSIKEKDGSFPDLRTMKKAQRQPIIKQKIAELKNTLRAQLNRLKVKNFEFDINGSTIEAKLYDTGINEVLEKLTQEKAGMLSLSKEIFENAEYLYSTGDKSGNPNVEIWDYFYVPIKIGEETSGVRVAVRKMKTVDTGQIYNWGIKKDTSLDGGSPTPEGRKTAGISSDVSANNIPQNGNGVNTRSKEKPGVVSAEEMYGLRPKAESKPGEITDADVAKPVDFKSMYGVDPDTQRKNGKGLSFEEWAESTKKPEQNKKAAEAVENKEPKVQSYEDFKKNPPADGEKSPIKVSPYTVIKSPYEGESPNNKADAKSERVEVSAESFAEGKQAYAYFEAHEQDKNSKPTLKEKLKEIIESIGGEHNVVVDGTEFNGKPYEIHINKNVAKKLAGDKGKSIEKFAVLKDIDNIIKNAEFVGSGDFEQHTVREKNVTRYDYFETKATIDGKPYVVAFDVEVIPGTNKYRTHKVLNEINLTSVPSVEVDQDSTAQGKKSGLQGDVPSPETNIPQNGNGVNSENRVNFEKAVEEAKKNAVTDEELKKKPSPERQKILERRIQKAAIDMGADELVDFAQAMGQIKGFFGSEMKDFARIFDDVVSSKPMRNKLHELFVQTAYIGIKNRNLATPIDEQASINTHEANNGTVSKNIMLQNKESVNIQFSKRAEKLAQLNSEYAKAVDMKRHFSQKQRTAIAFARGLANATDINIVFYQTEDGKGANGWYDAKTDTIYIDLFSGFNDEQAMLRTLSHELTHFIEKYSPEHYEGFKSFLLDYYYGKDEGATLERLIENEKRLAPNQTREYWENEVVANASEMFVKDEGAMRALIGEHADIAKSVDQWFSKMNYALRRAYKGVSTSGEASAELAANVEVFSEAQQRWNALLKESVEAKKAAGGTEKGGVQFSQRAEKLAQLDSEYAKAVESNDTETAERLVEEAARAAGYNSPLLYHGTQSFGFTKVDVSKSDDGISFFSTTNPDMAQTYSGEYGRRAIGKFSDRVINTLSLEQVVTRLNDLESNSKHPRKYYLMDRADVTKLESNISAKAKAVTPEIVKVLDEEKTRSSSYASERRINKINSFLDALKNKDAESMYQMLYDPYQSPFGDEVSLALRLKDLVADMRIKSRIDALGNVDEILVAEMNGRRAIGVSEGESARKMLKNYDSSGNYALYGKTDDFFEVDGKGTYWSDIFATLEPKGGNTFRAEYDSASSTLKLSDKNGQFAEIPANTLSEAESAMAKAITKRYGEYFGANVLARAKDQLRNSASAEVGVKTIGRTSTREIAQFAKEQGYRGVKITNIYDNGGRGESAGTGDVYIFFNPEADVKSADAVTYDEEGNVIPLSERFNEKNEDIRFSKRGQKWKPVLDKTEWEVVNSAVKNQTGNELTETTDYFFRKEKGKTVFGIYSTDDSTLLYAVHKEQAASEYDFLTFVLEAANNENINRENAGNTDTLLSQIGLQQNRHSGNNGGTAKPGRYVGNANVYFGKSRSNASGALRNVLENIFSERQTDRSGRSGESGGNRGLTVSDPAASGEVTLEVKKSTAEDDYTYDNIAIMLGGKEIGTIGMMADENEPYLERIDIDEAYRNKGIGTDALRLVAEKYGDFLIAPDNEDAKRLYERYGDESRQETHSQNHSPIIKAAHAHFEHGLLFALCGYAVFILTRSLSAISAINSLLVGLPLPL